MKDFIDGRQWLRVRLEALDRALQTGEYAGEQLKEIQAERARLTSELAKTKHRRWTQLLRGAVLPSDE